MSNHLPEMWFITTTAARWGGDSKDNKWVVHHATCIENVKAAGGNTDVALLGDSIMQVRELRLGRRAD